MVPKREIHESQFPTRSPYKPRAFCPRPPSPGEFPKGKFGRERGEQDGQERIQERNSATPGAYKRRGGGRGGGGGSREDVCETPRLATGPRYNVSMCGRVGRFAAGPASVPSSAWFVTRCTENAIWVFGLWPFKILIAKRGTGTQSGFGVDLVATQVWVRTQNFWVACRKCMKTHMIRNPNFGFGTQTCVWRRPCRKSGRRPGLVKSRGRGRRGVKRGFKRGILRHPELINAEGEGGHVRGGAGGRGQEGSREDSREEFCDTRSL